MATINQAVESAERLARMLSDMGVVSAKLVELAPLETYEAELRGTVEKLKGEVSAETSKLAEAKKKSKTVDDAVAAQAAKIIADAEEKAAGITAAAEAKAVEIAGSAESRRDKALADATAAEAIQAEASAKSAVATVELEKLESRLALARERAAKILQG